MLATRLKGAKIAANNLTYVGGYTEGILGTTSNTNITLTSLTGGIASSPSAGDLVIVYFGAGSSTLRTLAVSGYTTVFVGSASDTAANTNFIACFKFMPSTPDTQFTLTGGTGNAADGGAVAVHVWRNVDSLTPLDVISTTAQTSNTVLVNPPAITPITTGAVVVAGGVGGHERGTQTFSSSNLSNFLTSGVDDTDDATVGLGSATWTSGSFDPAQFTFSGADSTAFSNCSATIALRPNQNKTKPTATYIGTTQTNSASTTQTLTAVNIGTASSDRRVVVALGAVGTSAGFTFNSVTIGGVSATEHLEDGGEVGIAIYSLNVSSGTTANIVITGSDNFDVAAHVFTITGASTNYDTGATANTNSSSVTTAAINVGGNDVGIFLGSGRASTALSQTTSYGNLTESVDVVFTANANRRTCAGIITYDSGVFQSTVTLTGTNNINRIAIATFAS